MKRRKVWLVMGVVALVGLAATGVWGARAARAATERAVGLDLMPPELGSRPLGRFMHGNLARLRQLRDELGITPEQRKEIRGVAGAHRSEIVVVVRELRDAHRTLQAAAQAEPLDEAAVRARAEEMAGAIGDAAVLQAKVQREVKAKLTPEQIAKLDACRKDVQASVDEAVDQVGQR